MNLDGALIARYAGGQLLVEGPAGPLVTDTRQLRPGAWFLALVGERFDGHDFLQQARQAGCAGAVMSRPPPADWDRGLVRVGDSLDALQRCAQGTRQAFDGPVVGITGSVGKTTTRALAALALSHGERVHCTEGNLNNHIGVPLTLLARPPEATLMVVEMGMNAPGEIHLLQRIAAPDVRLITNVAAAHLEGLGDLAGVARAKGELFDGARPGDTLCVNTDDPRVASLPRPAGTTVLRYGRSPDCDVQLLEAALHCADPARPQDVELGYALRCGSLQLRGWLPAPGLYMARNVCAAFALALALGKPLDPVVEALADYRAVGQRMRVERSPGGILVLNDAYNANPASMKAALETLCAMPAQRRIALLGDMLELGASEAELHRSLIEDALAMDLSLLGVCGPRMASAAAELGPQARLLVASDASALAQRLSAALRAGDLLLLKGSRGMAMERILQFL